MKKEYDFSKLKVRKNPHSKRLNGEDLSSLAMKAMKSAIKKLIAEKKLRGEPMIIWKDGKVVKVPASQL